MTESGSTESGFQRLRRAVWFAGATLLVVFPLVRFFDRPLRDQLRLPLTPVDRVDAGRARQWTFLEESRRHLPPKSSFTVLAEDPEVEMALYMMSYGVVPDGLPLPTRYYGSPTPEYGREARFVLAFELPDAPDPAARLVARVPGGAVYERPGVK
jgi:hypothetical protein